MRGIIGPDRTVMALVALCAGLGASAWLAPQWLVFLLALAIAKGLVVLGLLLLMRTGLVSFGQGLYFGLGASELVERIEVTWPSGKQQVVPGPLKINSRIDVREQ